MFAFRAAEHALNLCFDDQVLWHRVKVSVCLDDGSEFVLSSGETEYEFHLEDQLQLCFSLKTVGQHLALSVSAKIMKGVSWPGRTWHPLKAITLHIESLGFLSGVCGHYLYNSWWTRPWFDRSLVSLPEQTQSLLWETGDSYRHMLAFCDRQLLTQFQGGDQEGVKVVISPQKAGVRSFSGTALILGFGGNPYDLMDRSVEVGRRQLYFASLQKEQRRCPEIFDYLGWCSWNACYLKVDEASVLAKAQEFQDKNIPVKWMLVDDGWSEEFQRSLLSYDEDRKKFPNGLRGLKATLVEQYEIPWLGVWQALTGQWEGLAAEARIEYVESFDEQRVLPATDFLQACGFWFNWHDYLAQQGVDFVKVDVQSNLLNHYRYRKFPGEVCSAVHCAVEASVALYFNGAMINCMGMSVAQLWHRPASVLARNSDDFFPDQENNIREFALQNAYNALYHDGFFQGDWDMWWSVHKDADAHAILRAVSGGPIYTSDPVDSSDADRIMKLVFNDGRIIRCDGQGKAVRECLFENPEVSGKLLKIWNRIGEVGALALVNISADGQEITERISHEMVEGIEGDDWLTYRPINQGHFPVSKMPAVHLKDAEAELFLFYPRSELFCLGLGDKLLPSAGIIDQFVTSYEDRRVLHVYLKQGGDLLIYSENHIRKIYINAQEYQCVREGELYTVHCREWGERVRVEVVVPVEEF